MYSVKKMLLSKISSSSLVKHQGDKLGRQPNIHKNIYIILLFIEVQSYNYQSVSSSYHISILLSFVFIIIVL